MACLCIICIFLLPSVGILGLRSYFPRIHQTLLEVGILCSFHYATESLNVMDIIPSVSLMTDKLAHFMQGQIMTVFSMLLDSFFFFLNISCAHETNKLHFSLAG